jgi:hypothetical protein
VTIFAVARLLGSSLCGLTYQATRAFCEEKRLPMQWRINEQAIRSAPHALVLVFMSIIAIGVLATYVYVILTMSVRPEQENDVFPILIFVGFLSAGSLQVYFWLIKKLLRRHSE